LLRVAARFDESISAVHHSCSGLFPEFFDLFRADFHYVFLDLNSDRKIAADFTD
jgi:hypothetical protein